MSDTNQRGYTLVMELKTELFDLNLKEVCRYRDLLGLFVRRDFVAVYKQTILRTTLPLYYSIIHRNYNQTIF